MPPFTVVMPSPPSSWCARSALSSCLRSLLMPPKPMISPAGSGPIISSTTMLVSTRILTISLNPTGGIRKSWIPLTWPKSLIRTPNRHRRGCRWAMPSATVSRLSPMALEMSSRSRTCKRTLHKPSSMVTITSIGLSRSRKAKAAPTDKEKWPGSAKRTRASVRLPRS